MKIIVSCFCFSEGWDSGNLKDNNNYVIYLKNSFVCLKSAKKSNPDCRCILFTNKQPPSFYIELFNNNSIEIIVVPFIDYVFDKNFKWALAYYKLNVLKFLSKGTIDFESVILLDNDIYVKDSLNDVFNDTNKYILLFDLCRRLNSPEYNVFYNDLKLVYGDNAFPLILYGGEFIGVSKTMLPKMIIEFDSIYSVLKKNNIRIMSGDEFFISVFADKNKNIILNSGNYIGRYWTGMYRIHSENAGYDYVRILHCPSEKKYGFLRLFTLLKKEKNITHKKVYRTLHLYHGRFHLPTVIWYLRHMNDKKK